MTYRLMVTPARGGPRWVNFNYAVGVSGFNSVEAEVP